MGTIAQKLTKLLATKADIKDAITDKGQTPGDVFADYPEKIRAIQTGVDTSDATATAEDIRGNVTAYAKGQKIKGTLLTLGTVNNIDYNVTLEVVNGYILEVSGPIKIPNVPGFSSTRGIVFTDSTVKIMCNLSSFGNATAADVRAGKTFTSADGIKVVGTGNF